MNDERLTTQEAADYLGVSLRHFENLLEDGRIPFHAVGAQRHVYWRDLLVYEKQRDAERRKALDKLRSDVDEAGLYDASYTGDAE